MPSMSNLLPIMRSNKHIRKLMFLMGECGRACIKTLAPGVPIRKTIGRHGTFRLDNKYIFSDFSNWSTAHNSGFDSLIESCVDKEVVLDVGAHIGLVTMPLSRVVSKTGRVYAFEPGTINKLFLQRHIEINEISNVEVLDLALGAKSNGKALFQQHKSVSGMNAFMVQGKSPDSQGAGVSRAPDMELIPVSVTTIDEFCSTRLLTPNVIKIDVEGAELLVLKGAVETLKEARPLIFLSVHPRQLAEFGSSIADLEHLIRSLDYVIQDPKNKTIIRGALQFKEYLLAPLS